MKRIKIVEGIILDSDSEPRTLERAQDILKCVKAYLHLPDYRLIKKQFDKYVAGVEEWLNLVYDEEYTLRTPFLRMLLLHMCQCYNGCYE